MLKHETRLIDPDADAIVATLTAAVADTNKRCRARLLKDDPAKWRKFARAAAAKSEGWEMFRGGKGGVPATQILASWWTDAAGRKHVVVRGRRVEHDEAKRLLHKEELAARPPLWHAYPEYVCRRTVGKTSEVVCACGCGAVGTPETLGWMGETCGPCHDRKEEAGAAAIRGNLPGVLYSHREPLGAIACSPDGTRVAAVEGDNSVTYWDIATRTRTVMKFNGSRVVDVAITSDGRHLLAVGMNLLSLSGLFAAFDLDTDPPRRDDPADEDQPATWRIAALPDPGLALVHRPNMANSNTRGAIVRVPTGEVVRQFAIPSGYGGRFAVSLDGKRLAALSPQGQTIIDLEGLRPVSELTGYRWAAAFSTDGKRLFAASAGTVQVYDLATRKWVAEGRTYANPLGENVRSLAIDPAGRYVYAGGSQGRVYVFAADDLKRLTAFDWHLGAVQGLAISADGARLFSSSADGCVKVWPIRDLTRGV